MKKGFFSVVLASAVLGATSYAFAGAYGEAEQAEEIPAPAPAAVPAPEPEEPRVMRKFSGFLTDSETTRGIWAELGSVYAAEYDGPSDADAVNTYAHISYGQEMFEVGVLMPYIYAHQDGIGHANDFGDLRLWGKVVPVRTDMFTFGLGLVTSFPTAGSDKGVKMGTDEYGFLPFLTMGVELDPVSIRSSIGYNVYTASGRGRLRFPRRRGRLRSLRRGRPGRPVRQRRPERGCAGSGERHGRAARRADLQPLRVRVLRRSRPG